MHFSSHNLGDDHKGFRNYGTRIEEGGVIDGGGRDIPSAGGAMDVAKYDTAISMGLWSHVCKVCVH